MRTLDYEKDPNPEHWRTISGAKVHLDNNGEIDGGAGGNFNGNYWDGKKGGQHIIGPHNMMKKNIGSGATMFNMAAMGTFNNKIEPAQPTEPAKPKPVKKPKAPKEPAFEFPQVIQRTKARKLDPYNSVDDFREQQKRDSLIRAIKNRSQYDNESHPFIKIRLEELSDSTGIPLEELSAPKTPEQIEKQFGSAFAEANNARQKPFTKAAIQKYKDALETLKNSDSDIASYVLSGINIKTLEKEPAEVYNTWMDAAKLIERLNNEKKNGITSTYDEWKKSVGTKDRNRSFLREQRLTQDEETLKEQAKIYKPNSVVGVPKGPDMDFNAADHKSANPNYRMIWDSDYKEGYRINCQTCVIAYEMRRRGYNVEAMPRAARKDNYFQEQVASWGTGLDDDGSAKAWIMPDGTHPIPKELRTNSRDDQYKWLDDNMVDGGRYTFCFCWQGRGAHIIHAFKENGVVKLYDPQNGNLFEGDEKVKLYLDGIAVNKGSYKPNPRLTRIDDCAPNMFYVNRILTPAK